MTAVVESAETGTVLPGMEFTRTVPRDLVHRHALSEVFLTDSRQIAADRFVAGAQIPSSHAYYTDHSAPYGVDPLLLLECCRQAETHAVHAHFGAPQDTKFVLQSWSLQLPGLSHVSGTGAAAEVTVDAETHDPEWRGEALRAMGYRMRVLLSGQHVGTAELRVQYLPGSLYAAMRKRKHGQAPPSSGLYREPPGPTAPPPHHVGRSLPGNVVLCEPEPAADRVAARVRVDGGHPSLFDHPQDHLPGMVLMEAGRQVSLLALGEFTGVRASRWALTGLRTDFHAYAELGEPLHAIAHRPRVLRRAGETRWPVTFEQAGHTVAEAVFTGSPRP